MKRLIVTRLLTPMPKGYVDVFYCTYDTRGHLVREIRSGGNDGKTIYIDDPIEGGIYSIEYGTRTYHLAYYVVWDNKAIPYNPKHYE